MEHRERLRCAMEGICLTNHASRTVSSSLGLGCPHRFSINNKDVVRDCTIPISSHKFYPSSPTHPKRHSMTTPAAQHYVSGSVAMGTDSGNAARTDEPEDAVDPSLLIATKLTPVKRPFQTEMTISKDTEKRARVNALEDGEDVPSNQSTNRIINSVEPLPRRQLILTLDRSEEPKYSQETNQPHDFDSHTEDQEDMDVSPSDPATTMPLHDPVHPDSSIDRRATSPTRSCENAEICETLQNFLSQTREDALCSRSSDAGTKSASPKPRPPSPSSMYTCPLCLSLLVRPITLECGASLCESCAARALHHAWITEQKPLAPCPVFGQRCTPLTRLPRLNVLLHNTLSEMYPQEYRTRLSEVSTPASKNMLAKIQARTARLVRLSRRRREHRLGMDRAVGPVFFPSAFPLPPIRGLREREEASGTEQDEIHREHRTARGGRRHWRMPGHLHLGDAGDDIDAADGIFPSFHADREALRFLNHLRFSLPFVLAVLIFLPNVPAQGRSVALARNGYALLLASSVGSHWTLWALVSALFSRSPGGARPGYFHELLKFRHLPQDLMVRIRLALSFHPVMGFCCVWMMLASVAELVTIWCRLTVTRLRLRQELQDVEEEEAEVQPRAPQGPGREESEGEGRHENQGNARASTGWWVATELLILLGALLWYEVISLASYRFLQLALEHAGPRSLQALVDPRTHHIYSLTWYLGVFSRILLGPFLPLPDLEEQCKRLRAVQGKPAWRTILFDPRITLLHAHSGLEVRLLNLLLTWAKEKVLGREAWWREEELTESENGESEEVPTPRAPRSSVPPTTENEDRAQTLGGSARGATSSGGVIDLGNTQSSASRRQEPVLAGAS